MRRWARSLGAAVAVLAAASGCSDPGADRAADVDPVEVAGRAVDRQADGGADAPPLPSRGCAAPVTDPASLQRAELSSRGVMREYFLTTPGGDEPLPLVVDLHGLMEGAQLHARHTALGELGLERGFVTVFPHGRGDPVRWDTRTGADDNADLAFLDAIVERVAARRCIDERRVYATGLSNGAMLASAVACDRSDRFAAVAPVGGLVAPEPCDRERAVPLMATHGTADPIVGFNGAAGGLEEALEGTPSSPPTADLAGPGHPAALAEWARRNGCAPDPVDERVARSVIHRSYDCSEGAPVSSYVVEGGGHAWPGSEFGASIESVTGPVTDEIDWNELVWAFFQGHSLP